MEYKFGMENYKNGPAEVPKKYIENSAAKIATMTKDWEESWKGKQKEYKSKFIKEYNDDGSVNNNYINPEASKIQNRMENTKKILQADTGGNWRRAAFQYAAQKNILPEKIVDVPKVSSEGDTEMKNKEVETKALSGNISNQETKSIMVDTKKEVVPKKTDEDLSKTSNLTNQSMTEADKKLLGEIKEKPEPAKITPSPQVAPKTIPPPTSTDDRNKFLKILEVWDPKLYSDLMSGAKSIEQIMSIVGGTPQAFYEAAKKLGIDLSSWASSFLGK